METGLLAILNSMIENGILADATLFLIIISILVYGFVYIIQPMAKKLEGLATIEQIKNEVNIEELSKKLDKMTQVLDEIKEFDRDSYREINELKRDIEQIKQILNQFQGHLMYGRSNAFGNRELK